MAERGRPTTDVVAVAMLHRVHAAGSGARFYGKRDRTWRCEDPAGKYGVLTSA